MQPEIFLCHNLSLWTIFYLFQIDHKRKSLCSLSIHRQQQVNALLITTKISWKPLHHLNNKTIYTKCVVLRKWSSLHIYRTYHNATRREREMRRFYNFTHFKFNGSSESKCKQFLLRSMRQATWGRSSLPKHETHST